MKKYVAELIGTMILVLMGCGSGSLCGKCCGHGRCRCWNTWSCFGLWTGGGCHGLHDWKYFGLPYQSGHYFGSLAFGRHETEKSDDVYVVPGCRSYSWLLAAFSFGFYRNSWRADNDGIQYVCS